MKKVFSVLLVFVAFFIVSCGGLLEEQSTNTVRFTLPGGNARALSASDVSYYNVTINNETFKILPPGAEVKSNPITVGSPVSVTVTAIGNYENNWGFDNKNIPVAFFSTTDKMQNGGLELNVKMKDYAMEYVKLSFNDVGDNLNTLVFSSEYYYMYSDQAAAPVWDDKTRKYFILPSGTKSGDETITSWKYNYDGHSGTGKPGDMIQLKYSQSGSGYTLTPNPSN